MTDQFVKEVRKYRMAHTKKFNYNIHAICDDLRKYQEELNDTLDIDKNRKFVNKSLQIDESK